MIKFEDLSWPLKAAVILSFIFGIELLINFTIGFIQGISIGAA